MDVTSKEYLNTLEALHNELILLKTDQNKLRYQIANFFDENKKLTFELKENAYERYLHLNDSDVVVLEQKYEAAVAAKNAAIEMWQAALQQIECQEELLMGKKSIIATERNEIEKQFCAMKNDYTKGLNILSEELSASHRELSKIKNDLRDKTTELEMSKTNLNSVCKELNLNKSKVDELADINKQLEEKIQSLTSLLEDSNKTLDAFTTELSTLKKENGHLKVSVAEMKDQNKKLKSEILVLENDAKDSLRTAQEAVLQKKEILYREEQYQKEVEVLKSSIDVEIQKASMKYKTEMKQIQKKATEEIQTLMSEIQQLHQEIGEKQNMFERANREKQAIESKLELLFSESSRSMPVYNSTIDDMCKRLTRAERSRDELELKNSSLELTLKELKSTKEQEIQYLLEKQQSLKQRTQVLLDDFNQASTDRLKLSDEVTKLRKKCYEQEQELRSLKSKHVKDISVLQKESTTRLHALQEQQHAIEEHYKSACSELQNLLQAEFKISNKWKAEVEGLISKSELKINEFCEEISQLKHNNSELINILHLNNITVPRQSMYLIKNVE